jgi:hypothetical protein
MKLYNFHLNVAIEKKYHWKKVFTLALCCVSVPTYINFMKNFMPSLKKLGTRESKGVQRGNCMKKIYFKCACIPIHRHVVVQYVNRKVLLTHDYRHGHNCHLPFLSFNLSSPCEGGCNSDCVSGIFNRRRHLVPASLYLLIPRCVAGDRLHGEAGPGGYPSVLRQGIQERQVIRIPV